MQEGSEAGDNDDYDEEPQGGRNPEAETPVPAGAHAAAPAAVAPLAAAPAATAPAAAAPLAAALPAEAMPAAAAPAAMAPPAPPAAVVPAETPAAPAMAKTSQGLKWRIKRKVLAWTYIHIHGMRMLGYDLRR